MSVDIMVWTMKITVTAAGIMTWQVCRMLSCTAAGMTDTVWQVCLESAVMRVMFWWYVVKFWCWCCHAVTLLCTCSDCVQRMEAAACLAMVCWRWRGRAETAEMEYPGCSVGAASVLGLATTAATPPPPATGSSTPPHLHTYTSRGSSPCHNSCQHTRPDNHISRNFHNIREGPFKSLLTSIVSQLIPKCESAL